MKTTTVATTVSFAKFNSFVIDDEQINRMTLRLNDAIPCYVKKEKDSDEYVRSTTNEISDYETRLIAIICNLDPRFGMLHKRAKQTNLYQDAMNAAISDASIEIEITELEKGEKISTHAGEYVAPRDVVVTKIVKIEFIKEVDAKLDTLRTNILDAIML